MAEASSARKSTRMTIADIMEGTGEADQLEAGALVDEVRGEEHLPQEAYVLYTLEAIRRSASSRGIDRGPYPSVSVLELRRSFRGSSLPIMITVLLKPVSVL
jgi:hypothetical protein